MILDTFRRVALDPGLNLLPQRMDTVEARVMLVAIALQESRIQHRRQKPVAHARGYWQFERGGGVRGVLRHRSTKRLAAIVCEELDVRPVEAEVYEAITYCDTLACVFARLLLWTLPRPLPDGDAAEGWKQYIETWRPGKPRPDSWPRNFQKAQEWVTW